MHPSDMFLLPQQYHTVQMAGENACLSGYVKAEISTSSLRPRYHGAKPLSAPALSTLLPVQVPASLEIWVYIDRISWRCSDEA